SGVFCVILGLEKRRGNTMHHDTWKGVILQKQGLLKPQSVQQICQNLNGLQTQFQPYVYIGFRNRMTNEAF
ncbi:TPA: hypothetical protein ACGO7W_001933, partial [Streptococcus suis]